MTDKAEFKVNIEMDKATGWLLRDKERLVREWEVLGRDIDVVTDQIKVLRNSLAEPSGEMSTDHIKFLLNSLKEPSGEMCEVSDLQHSIKESKDDVFKQIHSLQGRLNSLERRFRELKVKMCSVDKDLVAMEEYNKNIKGILNKYYIVEYED